MEPQRYGPSSAALNYLLMIAGYLRDLGVNNTSPIFPPHINITKNEIPDVVKISTAVRNIKNGINSEAMGNDDVRLTGQWLAAKQVVKDMKGAALQDPTVKDILSENRTWDFNELLPFGKKTLTLDGMLEELENEGASYFGSNTCMNYLGGQATDWISELVALPKAAH